MIKFTYHGEAVGKGRPRVTVKKSKNKDNGQIYAHAYTPKKTKEFEGAIRFEFMASNCEPMPVYPRDKTLKAEILIGVPIPKSYPKYKQALCRCRMIAPNKKPDIDNIVKSIFDALQGGECGGYAFADDSQIVKVVAEKVYADEPFVEVMIDEL